MLDKSAIQQIQQFGSIPQLLEHISQTDHQAALLPKDFELKSLEKLNKFRDEYRGTMTTQHIEEFVKYSKEFEASGAKCFISSENMSAKAVFDLGTIEQPGHCYNTAKLNLRETAAYTALTSKNDERQRQKELAEWIEDYSEFLQIFSTDGELIEASVASAAIRNMKFEAKAGRETNVDDFSQHQSEYESIAVRTKDEFPMPAVFKFTCIPYVGLSARTFEMRLCTIGNEVLLVRIKRLEQHQEEMAEEFLNVLTTTFSDHETKHITTHIGTFSS